MAVKIPSVTGSSVESAKNTLTAKGLTYKVIGDGTTVVKQFPTAAESIYSDGVVMLYTEESAEITKVTVPDFSGLSVSSVNELAKRKNVNVVFSGTSSSGSGVVAYKQSIAAETEVDAGTVITVYFRSTETTD